MKPMLRTLFALIVLLPAIAWANNYPLVLDPMVTATPPGAKVSAGYMTLTNESDKAITITGAYSPDVAKVEIHLSLVENDVAKMQKQDSLTIEPNASLTFEHGSYHIMLMDLEDPLKENTTIDIVLITSSGDMLIEMPIKKLGHGNHGANGEKMSSDMKHEDMNEADTSMKSMTDDKTDTESMPKPAKVVH